MAAMDAGISSNTFTGTPGGYDPKILKNYAAMSANFWPGWDTAGYAAAAYSQAQANALAAAASAVSTASSHLQNTHSMSSNVAVMPQQTMIQPSSSVSPPKAEGLTLANGCAIFPAHSTTSGSPKVMKVLRRDCPLR